MRIIAGKLKGSILNIPKNINTRPLKDIARESIFNLLTHSNKVFLRLEQSNILDLYAGTGSFGLECLSRQAESVCFVEKRKDAIEILEKNIEKLKLKNKVKIFFDDVFDVIKKKNIFESKFDLIFCDPPFKDRNTEKLIELVFDKKLLNKNGIIILHRNKVVKEKLPNCIEIIEERTYGISKIIFGKFLS
jgi:16S rRNA (guanine966-N2)-methyltransferase